MDIRFWGVRGSVATPLTNRELTEKIGTAVRMALEAKPAGESEIEAFVRNLPWPVGRTAGGDTACVEVRHGETLIILDAGTGIRGLGLELAKRAGDEPVEAHILLTHTHWDHISGLPFFVPGFNPHNRITVYGPQHDLKERLEIQQFPEFFPVPLAKTYRFIRVGERDKLTIGGMTVRTAPLIHPGDSYSYRLTAGEKTVVYATDSEYKDLSKDALKPFTRFFQGADLLIFDAQYTMLENIEKEDWGHSNIFTGVDMALEAGVKRIVFTHHEPTYDDQKLWRMLERAREYLKINHKRRKLELHLAHEGLTIAL